jgi:hypothetical protein
MPPTSQPPSPNFENLIASAAMKKMQVVLPIHGIGRKSYLRIEVIKDGKVVEYEVVKKSETVEHAAKRMATRLRKERILD